MNKLNHQKQVLLDQIHSDLIDSDPSAAAHILALKQKAVDCQYDNLLIVEQE